MFAIREGKNREVRNVMAHLGLEVNRLIRISYGRSSSANSRKVRSKRSRRGCCASSSARRSPHWQAPISTGRCRARRRQADDEDDAPRGKKPFKPAGKSGLIADRKGRRVLVQRTGSDEARARNEAEANGYGPPRRPQRGYHGKRDLKPRDE